MEQRTKASCVLLSVLFGTGCQERDTEHCFSFHLNGHLLFSAGGSGSNCCQYCEKFVADYPGELDMIKWALFDDTRLKPMKRNWSDERCLNLYIHFQPMME